MNKNDYNKIINQFHKAGANMRCIEVKKHLVHLGFDVTDGKRGGHKIVTHQHLPNFYSLGFNCDHGKNPEVKRPYLKKIIKLLQQHEEDIINYLEKQS